MKDTYNAYDENKPLILTFVTPIRAVAASAHTLFLVEALRRDDFRVAVDFLAFDVLLDFVGAMMCEVLLYVVL